MALLAVEQHDADVAVLDESDRFMGAIPIGRLLALLHEEHVDDILRMGVLPPSILPRRRWEELLRSFGRVSPGS